MKQQAQGKPGKKRTPIHDKQPARPPGAAAKPRQTAAAAPVLEHGAPAWLNWAAVTLAVLIVAGVFFLSARQLSAPQNGVSANQMELLQGAVGGMLLNTDAEPTASEGGDEGTDDAAPAPATSVPARVVVVGETLTNPAGRVRLYADADPNARFLDSYAQGGRFMVMEPSGDFSDYPVVVADAAWVRVRAGDGLVGWTPVEALEPAP